MSRENDIAFLKARANKLQRAMIAKGWSRKALAAEAHCDEKTLRNVFAGEAVRDQTILTLARVLGIDIDLEAPSGAVDVSDELYGGYGRSVNSSYEGHHAVYRRTFSVTGGIYRSPMFIGWSDKERRFIFSESFVDSAHDTGARAHSGTIYISAQTNLVHLLRIMHKALDIMNSAA
jgi:transcriptional regulator with XRE-family HTH domain